MIETHAHETPAFGLFSSTLARLATSIPLTEQMSEDGQPWRTLISHAPFHHGPCGAARLYNGPGLAQILTCSITVPAIGLDSHMLFAFAPSNTATPHFTIDAVQSGQDLAFHLDLIPRLDLGVHLSYMDYAFSALTDACAAASQIEGLSPANISPRQRAVMSPWMVVNRATPEAFGAVKPVVVTYLDHWLGLVATGVPAGVLAGMTPAQLIARDKANKAVIFDPDVDKVWNQIRGVIGDGAVEAIRAQLLRTDGYA